MLIGFSPNDLGAFFTRPSNAFREREKILNLFEEVSGSRMMGNYSGSRVNGTDGREPCARDSSGSFRDFPAFLDEFEALLTKNEILCMRCRTSAFFPAALRGQRRHHGTGPRASGGDYDIRKVDATASTTVFVFRSPRGPKRRRVRPVIMSVS